MLNTGRLVLRLAEPADAEAIADLQLRNRDYFGQWSSDRSEEFFTPEYWRKRAHLDQEAATSGASYRFWAFLTDEPRNVVGSVSIRDIRPFPNLLCEIGYSVDRERVGQGLATEMAAAAIRFAYQEVGMRRIEATYMPANVPSARVLAKLGFTVEGTLRGMLNIRGQWEDHVIASLLEPEWRAQTEQEEANLAA